MSEMAVNYQQLINDGINGLPPGVLAEIADFVYFIRQRTLRSSNMEVFPQAIDTAERARILKSVTERMRRTPLPTTAPRWTREELHARR